MRYGFFLYILVKKNINCIFALEELEGGVGKVPKKKWRTLSGESLYIFCIDSHDNTMFQEYNMEIEEDLKYFHLIFLSNISIVSWIAK